MSRNLKVQIAMQAALKNAVASKKISSERGIMEMYMKTAEFKKAADRNFATLQEPSSCLFSKCECGECYTKVEKWLNGIAFEEIEKKGNDLFAESGELSFGFDATEKNRVNLVMKSKVVGFEEVWKAAKLTA